MGKSFLMIWLMKRLLNQKISLVAGSPTKQRVAQSVRSDRANAFADDWQAVLRTIAMHWF